MRDRLVPWIVLAMLCVAPGPASAATHEAGPLLRLTEVLPSPDAAAQQREFVEVQNAGPDPVDLAGWRLRDAPTASNATNEYTFPAVRLAPGERIVVWSNGSADGAGLAWSASASKAVWNDAGDAATLLDPSGQVRDWVGYGSTSQAPPPGFPPKSPAPARGRSLQWADGAWSAADPTPGRAPGQQGGTAAAQVANVPPAVALDAPPSVRAGETVTVHLGIQDPNGAADVTKWTLAADGRPLRQGNATHDGPLVLTAPATGATWRLTAVAWDAAGANGTAEVTVALRVPRLAIALPPGGSLRFPELRPGDRDVTSLDAFSMRNEGEDPVTPLLDVSPFRANGAEIPVERNLWVGVTTAGATTWLRYDAALQPLPALAPGAAATLALRIGDVPVPTPAGLYGTTFTVVPS